MEIKKVVTTSAATVQLLKPEVVDVIKVLNAFINNSPPEDIDAIAPIIALRDEFTVLRGQMS